MQNQGEAPNNTGAVCPESTIESANRRNFIKKAALASAAIGIGSTLSNASIIPRSSASSYGAPVVACTSAACGVAVDGTATGARGIGVLGKATTCTGHGVCGRATAAKGVGVRGLACDACAVPLVARGKSSQGANLQQWQRGCCIVDVVNKCGWFGIGTRTPSAPLDVVGSSSEFNSIIAGKNSGCGSGVSGCSSSGVGVCGRGKSGVTGSSNIETGTGVSGFSCCGIGVSGCSHNVGVCGNGKYGVKGRTCYTTGIGLFGVANSAGGIPIVARNGSLACGFSDLQQWQNHCGTALAVVNEYGWLGIGISTPSTPIDVVSSSTSTSPKIAILKNGSAVACSDRSSYMQFANGDCTSINWNVGVSGSKNASCIPDGNFYLQHCSTKTPAISVNKCGHVGIGGALNPGTTLRVCGSIAAKVVSPTGPTYQMLASDFAVLAGTASMTVTLPSANSATGQIVFIKNISSGSVSVDAKSGDHIEAGTSLSLASEYASVQLMSNGKASPNGVWYIIANGT